MSDGHGLFSDVDPSIRPGDDLYRHVNGRWLASATIPDDQALTGTFPTLMEASRAALRQILDDLAAGRSGELVTATPAATPHEAELLADLYRRFTDVDAVEAAGVEPLRPVLDQVEAIATTRELMGFLGWALGHFPAQKLPLPRSWLGGLFSMEADTDPARPDRNVAWIGQAGIGLPDQAYYHDPDKAGIRDAYTGHIARSLTLAGLDKTDKLAATVMGVETRIASHHWDRVRSRNVQAIYNPMSFDQLADSHPGLFLDRWRQAACIPEQALATVNVGQPSFLDGIQALLAEVPLDDWKAWTVWTVVRGYAPYLSQDLAVEHFDFFGRTLAGTPELEPRWKQAVSFVESIAGQALGKFYVARHFPPAAKQRAGQLVTNLLDAYRDSITGLGWMGEQTRAQALTKLEAIRVKIGCPDRWQDVSGLALPAGGGLIGAVQAGAAFDLGRTIDKLSTPVDPEQWGAMFPQTVDAYYNPLANEIVFPAAILQPPFFDPDADDAVNYGGIGTVIGHEIGHAFDDQGSAFDADGRLHDWWTPADHQAFTGRTSALIDQYNQLVPPQLRGSSTDKDTDLHVNGALTIGENIGDLGGAGIAYLALTRSFTDTGEPEPIDGLSWPQRFFLSYARIWRLKIRDEQLRQQLASDPHSPAEFRVNQIVRNIDAFYQAFDVGPADKLWLDPDQRVTIW